MRAVPTIFSDPHRAVICLHPDEVSRGLARRQALNEWESLLATDAAALAGHQGAQAVLDYILWRQHDSTRLFFAVWEREGASATGPHTTSVARSMCLTFADEKPAEDVRQHVRDVQRARRHKVVSRPQFCLSPVAFACIQRAQDPCSSLGKGRCCATELGFAPV